MTLTGPREHGGTKIHRTQVTEVLLLLLEPFKKDLVPRPSMDTEGSNRSNAKLDFLCPLLPPWALRALDSLLPGLSTQTPESEAMNTYDLSLILLLKLASRLYWGDRPELYLRLL